MNKAGFILLEFILYCASGTTLVMAFMYYTSTMHIQLKHYQKKSLHFLSFYAGIQYTFNILEKTPTLVHYWKKRTKDEIIYTKDNQDRGWCVLDNRLVHILGIYNTHEQRWISKTVYPIISHVHACTFSLTIHQNTVSSIDITLDTQDYDKTSYTIHCKQGPLYHQKKLPLLTKTI